MNDCIFCKIVKDDAPSAKVYEDDKVVAFMNIRPRNPGECLMIPKAHVDRFTDLDDDLSAHLMVKAQAIGRKIQEVFEPLRVGYVVHGFGVAHAHLIIIPLKHPDDIASARYAKIEDGKIVFDENLLPLADAAELAKEAELIKP